VGPVAEVPVLTETADLELMASFLGMLLDGEGDEGGARWALELGELKARGLVRQTRVGRPMPTLKGRALWTHVRAVRARMALGKAASAGQPFFVVFGPSKGGIAFRDWAAAQSHARTLVEGGFLGKNGSLSGPEDLIETWPASHLAPEVALKADLEGDAVIEDDEDGEHEEAEA
jgi:hypothetical protein